MHKKAAVADLQNTRNTALSNLQAEQQQNAANYAAQRNTANAQNRLSARNFQEYLANTGRANSGLGAQASMQYNNNLNTSMNNIYGAENAALADIARRRTDAQNAYSSGLASANATIEANYIQNLLKQQQQDWENKMALKQFNESVRQYNQNRKDSLRVLAQEVEGPVLVGALVKLRMMTTQLLGMMIKRRKKRLRNLLLMTELVMKYYKGQMQLIVC